MKKISFYMSLFVAILTMGFMTTSCCDDTNRDYTDYVIGSWNANSTDAAGNTQNLDAFYIWTFNAGGTGIKVLNKGGIVTEKFRYTVESYSSKAGTWYDFAIRLTFLKPNGDVDYEDTVYCSKKNGKTWNLCTLGEQVLYQMKKN